MPTAADHEFLRSPQPFGTVLADLRPSSWPPTDHDLNDLAGGCIGFIDALDSWESATSGQNVVDVTRGSISTADARRLLAQEVLLSYEGDLAVLLVPEGHHRVRAELHGKVDEYQGVLRPALALVWEHGGEEHMRWFALKHKGAQWYMLSQLRDDLREDRLVGS